MFLSYLPEVESLPTPLSDEKVASQIVSIIISDQ